VAIYLAIRNGEMERVTHDVEQVTGMAPMSFHQFPATNRS